MEENKRISKAAITKWLNNPKAMKELEIAIQEADKKAKEIKEKSRVKYEQLKEPFTI